MRTPTIIYGLKNSQKLRVLFKGDGSENDIGLFMTVQQMVTMFATGRTRSLAWESLLELSSMRNIAKKDNEPIPIGLCTTIRGKQIQIDII